MGFCPQLRNLAPQTGHILHLLVGVIECSFLPESHLMASATATCIPADKPVPTYGPAVLPRGA
jgi:hypothetical protein